MAASETAHTDIQPVTETLARFAKGLRVDAIPAHTQQMVRFCLIDAIACAAFGQTLPWSQSVLRVAQTIGQEGGSQLPGVTGVRLHPAPASLALGAFSHAFELDNLRKPGLGVHGGATVALPAFALAQHIGASGRDLVSAITAGIEVMFRIGVATLHTPEKAGFHAPGLTGPFGAATACCLLMGASERQIMDAYGIAGSLASGLLAFSKAEQGGMVKRLHLGRAAEGGVLAALLAMEGFEGPHTVLDGRYGLLDAFCSKYDTSCLTAGLGEVWEADRICFKSTACHITSHSPLEAMRQLTAEFKITVDEIDTIEIEGSEKMVTHHNIPVPTDIMLAQYSIPFVVAASLYHDVSDPKVFNDALVKDTRVLDMAQRIKVGVRSNPDAPGGWGVDVTIVMRDGRRLSRTVDAFPGTPELPFTRDQIGAKFMTLTKGLREPGVLLEHLYSIEAVKNVGELDIS